MSQLATNGMLGGASKLVYSENNRPAVVGHKRALGFGRRAGQMRDVDGNEVSVGDVVKVLAIDAEFLECLTVEEKSHHAAMVGNDYVIDELVEDGLKASVFIEWEIEGGVAFGGLYMLSSEFRLTRNNPS